MNPTAQSRRRAHRRGVTLFEVLIVVSLLALLAAAIGYRIIEANNAAMKKLAATQAADLRRVTQQYLALGGRTECPSFDDLLAERAVDEGSARADPWGSSWRIECDDERVTVRSNGPDRTPDTADDIVAPPPPRENRVAEPIGGTAREP